MEGRNMNPRKPVFLNNWFPRLKSVLCGIQPGMGIPCHQRLGGGDLSHGSPARVPMITTNEEITMARETRKTHRHQ